MKIFFCIGFSVYSCHLFLISSASVRSIPFLSFTLPMFAWNIPLVSLISLKRSLVFPILLFSSIFLHCSLKKAFLPLFPILWNSAFRWVYLSFYPLSFTSLLSSAICKVSSDNHFALLQFFFLGLVLITTFCTTLQTSVHSTREQLWVCFSACGLYVLCELDHDFVPLCCCSKVYTMGLSKQEVNKVNNEKKVATAYDLWPQEAPSVKSSSEFVV